jgi:hypothetical protein
MELGKQLDINIQWNLCDPTSEFSDILWLLENNQHWQTLTHNVVFSTPHLIWIQTHNVVVIDTDCICSYNSNDHAITTRTTPCFCKCVNIFCL